MIYLDHAATTPVLPEVAAAMAACLTESGDFGNSGSTTHAFGAAAAEKIAQARADVAALIGAQASEILFTSGATEANNLAIKGTAQAYRDQGRHMITSRIEHKAVVDVCRWLETQGWDVSWIEPDRNGEIQPQQVENVLRADTVLVSLMQVNNELGVITDIAAIAELLKAHPARLHVDAAQVVGKLPIDVAAWGVDYLSLSAHKFGGPKGSGALFLRHQPRARVEPQIHGGGQQQGLRAGTLATHQIVGLGEAAKLAKAQADERLEKATALQKQFEAGLLALEGITINGQSAARSPWITNFSVAGVHGAALIAGIRDSLAVSAGSACMSAVAEPSYVLRAIGHDDALAEATLRASYGFRTSLEDIDNAVERLHVEINRLRNISIGRDCVARTDLVAAEPGYLAYFAKPTNLSPQWNTEQTFPTKQETLRVEATVAAGIIGQIGWQALAGPEVIAVAAWLSEAAKNQPIEWLTNLDASAAGKMLGLADDARYAILFVQDVFLAALEKAAD